MCVCMCMCAVVSQAQPRRKRDSEARLLNTHALAHTTQPRLLNTYACTSNTQTDRNVRDRSRAHSSSTLIESIGGFRGTLTRYPQSASPAGDVPHPFSCKAGRCPYHKYDRYRARTLYLAVRPSVARVSLLGVEWECAHHVCAAAEWTRTHVYVHRSEFSQRSTPDTTSPHCILLTYRSYRLPIPIRIDSALETSHTRTSQITFVSVRCNRNC